MRTIFFTILFCLFYSMALGASIVVELNSKNTKKSDSNLIIIESDDIVTFKYKWGQIKKIPINKDDPRHIDRGKASGGWERIFFIDTVYTLPYNTSAELIIKDGDRIISESTAIIVGYYFYFCNI